ncbi:MAG: polysaccharide export protein [Alphaproteobacteria bacterium]|nr:polysaccharide export protein [Alphaproteobacteria bacterium]
MALDRNASGLGASAGASGHAAYARVFRKGVGLVVSASLAVSSLTSCSGLPGAGPTAGEVTAASKPTSTGETRFALIDVDPNVVAKMESWSAVSLQGTFGKQGATATQAIGQGDYVQVTIWEAASGGLFSAPANAQLTGSGSRQATIPEQVVGPDGAITVPYAGRVQVRDRTPQQVEQAVVTALTGKAIEPQALVTVTKNVANTVTVVGEVTGGARVPLTTRGDRILDVVASAGGTKAAAHETFVTLVRGRQSVRIPMQALLTNPSENVFVKPGDVISVAKEPQTFTSAGATGQNSVVPFDSIGITLDQAIARAGGLSDTRADPGGVFVIRYERPEEYDQLGFRRPDPGALPQVPVIYRVNMRDPNGFFMARRFPIRNKDILFVSTAPAAEMQKVINVLIGFVGAAATVVAVSAATR